MQCTPFSRIFSSNSTRQFFIICCCKPNAQTNHSIVMDQQPKDNKGRSCRETKSLKQKRRINPFLGWLRCVDSSPPSLKFLWKKMRSVLGPLVCFIVNARHVFNPTSTITQSSQSKWNDRVQNHAILSFLDAWQCKLGKVLPFKVPLNSERRMVAH